MSTVEEEPQGVPLCPNCFAECEPDSDFCSECGRPMSAIATVDPLRRVYSQGFWFRRTVDGRVRPIVFWGTWLVLGPTFIFFVIASISWPFGGFWGATGAFGGILALGGAVALGLLLSTMTRNYIAGPAEADPGNDEADDGP